jgi:hypothetical protein
VNGNAASRVFYIAYVTVTISNLTITNGYASAWPSGGGIYNEGGTLMIINSTISGNSGGGIYNFGSESDYAPLMITNSTISGNSGAGIANEFNEGAMLITNSTISGNSGGGIHHDGGYCSNCAFATITNSTLSDNGIFNGSNSGGLTIGNTILKASSIASFSYFPVTSLGYNLSDDAGGGVLTGPGDQINTDSMLGPLQDNGGPTFTHKLLSGSPAIDAGDPSFTPPPGYDQRGPGFPRVVNGRIDIGAFEVQPDSPPSCAAQVQPPINADGSSVFNVRRGVVPVKFSLTCNGNPTCDLSPATIAVTRTAGGATGQVNESVYSGPSDSGSNFRIEGCEYHYNLYSNALGAGTYRVDILINGQVIGSATFQFK